MYIVLENYNPNWIPYFEEEKRKIQRTLDQFDLSIEHIGSTSVDGMIAKPIIDILVGLESKTLFESATKRLQKNGYIYYSCYNGSYPDRRHFVKVKEPHMISEIKSTEEDIVEQISLTRLFHIHITEYGSEFWHRHIVFRDSIKIHHDLKEQYVLLKQQLAKENWSTLQDYAEAKTEFIRHIEKRFGSKL